jgi:hypothetical protein
MNNLLLAANNFTLNLEAIGILLGILVSVTILLGLLIQFANRINKLEHNLQYLKQEILEHSNLEGHKILIDKLGSTDFNLLRIEKAFDLHVQDYISRKEFIHFMIGQLDQKIDHKFERLNTSVKDTEKFLQKTVGFRVRSHFDDRDGQENI